MDIGGEYRRRSFTTDEVVRLAELGFFDADEERVELLDGELVIMPPQDPAHASLTVRVRELLDGAYGNAFHARAHSPLRAGDNDLPEPDVTVIRGAPRDYRERLPTAGDAPLIVEIAQTSHARDRDKAGIYAAAGGPVYWLIDLPRRRVEVYEEPTGDGQYLCRTVVHEDGELTLPEVGGKCRVSELLP